MPIFIYDDKIKINPKFYYDYEKSNTILDMMRLFEYYEYICFTILRFLFVKKIKLAKLYVKQFFNKNYEDLNQNERFYITYYIFNLNFVKSYDEFQKESNYKVIKKIVY